jgi:hypothetical protein
MIKQTIKRGAIRVMTLPGLFRLMNKALNTRPIIFTLHRKANPEFGIGGHDPAMVRKQLEFLLRHGYRMVTMDVIDAWVNGEDMDMTNTVAFTFDDGYRDQADLIREVFLPLGVPASMFLITDFIDGKDWPWDAPHRNPPRLFGGELRVLADAGYTAAVTMTPGIVDRREPGNAYGSLSIHRFGMPDDLEDFVQYLSWIERLKEGIRAVSPRTWIDRRHGSREAMVESWQTNLDHRLGRLKVSSAVDWSKVRRLVFICQGNVCRSPFAEAVAREHGTPRDFLRPEDQPGHPRQPDRIEDRAGDGCRHDRAYEPALRPCTTAGRRPRPRHGAGPPLAGVGDHIGAKDVQWTLLGLHLPKGKVPYIADPYGTSDAYHRRCFGMIRAGSRTIVSKWLRHPARTRVGDTRRTNGPLRCKPGRADT